MTEIIASDLQTFDGNEIVIALNKFLRLRTTPIGMKLFKTVEEMESVERIRRPKDIHTTDQIVGQASRNGLRYQIPQYGVNNDVRAGMRVSYA